MPNPSFTFYLSCDIDFQVKVKVVGLQGQLPSRREANQDDSENPSAPSLYVSAKLHSPEAAMGLETRTRYAECDSTGCKWGDWLTFCEKYRDLPHNAQLCVNVWELSVAKGLTLVGGCTIPFFNKKGRLKTGSQRLKIWEGKEADPSWFSSTPGKVPIKERGQIGTLEHLLKLYARGDVFKVDWLDALSLEEIHKLQIGELHTWKDKQELQLLIELPTFPHAVLYQESASPLYSTNSKEPGINDSAGRESIITLHDPEVGKENPAELKAAKLARSVTRGVIDKELKPNSEERKQLSAILKSPPNRPLPQEDKALLWRFRYSLTSHPRALTKFLKCVDWTDVSETKQVVELMQGWAAITIADALELLSPDFRAPEVRAHAVATLQSSEDDELLGYLLQLVQALRYEASHNSRLARFLVSRAAKNPSFAVFLHWYLFTEWEDPGFGTRASAVHGMLISALQQSPLKDSMIEAMKRQSDMMSQLAYIVKELKSSKLKANRATERFRDMVSEDGPCSELATMRVPLPLSPIYLLEGLVPQECFCFKSAQLPLKLSFKVDPTPMKWLGAAAPGAVSQRIVEPSSGVVRLADESWRCYMIYKKGDDLRQDQFVLQMIRLMDVLLKRENLDLRITPYHVLPTSSDDGLVEFVPSLALAKILADHRTINRYLAQFNPDPHGPFGLKVEVLENFVRSCAGYCVMTYILGVGDRHLDNLMLTTDGKLFHIDFGYILGRDPKPFPPPMKLCREMIEAMGGADSNYYVQFRMYSCEAYNILRKSADLILSLFHLMAGSSISSIREDPEKALLRIQEKLRLDANDEQAVDCMQQLINESATALMPQIVETTHRWAQYWR